MFRVLEAAKQLENSNRFLQEYSRQRKQRRKGPAATRHQGGGPKVGTNDDFPSLTDLKPATEGLIGSSSYAAVLRKGLVED
jgi:hypothetical protein